MLRPSADELLVGVADALAETVAAALPEGPKRDEVRAAVGVLRRLARALPTLVPRLEEDTIALARAVRDVGGSAVPADVVEALALADALVVAPGLDELRTANLALRGELARLATEVAPGSDADGSLRRHLRQLVEREAALRLSPWER